MQAWQARIDMDGKSIYTRLGFTLLCIFCFLYAIFYRYFAQLHIKLNFLEFPVFVGEILLFICVALLFLKWKHQGHVNPWYWLLAIYFGWLLVKAYLGYTDKAGGPLAFRNAALFYYPIFLIFGFEFFDKRFFNQRIIALIVIAVLAVLAFVGFYN